MSHNEGRILRATPDGGVETVLDPTAIRTNIADLVHVPGRRRMAVFPTFTGGRVAAYRLDR